MGGSAWRRALRALLLVWAVILTPAVAGVAAAAEPVKVHGDDLPIPRDLTGGVSHLEVAGVALGAVAGAVLGNFLSGGLMTPLLTAGWAEGGAAAASATGVEYGLSLIATTVTTSLGAFMGNWLASGH
jgi:hypothetical protein